MRCPAASTRAVPYHTRAADGCCCAQAVKKAAAKKPAKKAAKAKAAAPKRKRAEQLEVESIVGMRVDSKGGIQYQVQWKKDKSKTWEPEANVLDDDLVDEFEAAEQKKAFGTGALKNGATVEVLNTMEAGHATQAHASPCVLAACSLCAVRSLQLPSRPSRRASRTRGPRPRWSRRPRATRTTSSTPTSSTARARR